MFGGKKKTLAAFKQWTTILLIVVIFSGYGVPFLDSTQPRAAEAAGVTIDANAQATISSHTQSGSQTVFTSDQVGYKFFVDAPGYCVYRKTINGGTSWSATTSVNAQIDCIAIEVWYDQWTPGMAAASTSIHIVTMDSGNDDIWYNRLNTTNDTLLLASTSVVSMLTGSGQGASSLAATENHTSVTRGTDGTLYSLINDGSGGNDSFVIECTVSCQTAANWTEVLPMPLDVASDKNILLPMLSGNIMLINRDISADDMRYKIWNNTTWSAAWTAIDANAPENVTYDVGFAASVSSTSPTTTLFMAYTAFNNTLGTDDQIRTAKFTGNAWATSSNVISGSTTLGITNVALGLDAANDDVYVLYSGRNAVATPASAQIYWSTATSSMKNWSTVVGPINTTPDDMNGVDLNLVSDQRIFGSWFDNTDDDIFGDTIADIYPGVHASATSIQSSPLYASTSEAYLGGTFLLTDTYKNHTITALTITETGSIDAAIDLKNIKIHYDTDATYPYNCQSESYAATDPQFGSTDTDGFSWANGSSTLSGGSVNVSSTTSMCAYVVFDIQDTAPSISTLEIEIDNPATDVVVTNWTVQSTALVQMASSTNVINDIPTQSHFHFRNDNGTEVTATSKTGGTEDTALGALSQSSSTRLRIEVSNEGSSSTPALQYRLEYAQTAGVCSAVSSWTDVGAVGGDFDMFNSTNLTDGNNTTNISVGSGGVTDDNPEFVTANGGIKDTSSQTSGVVSTSTQFIELEYSIIASTSAATGARYCFRVSDAGRSLYSYTQYPTLTINPDVLVAITASSQTTATSAPATNFYVGSAFSITEYLGSRNVTSITIAENGTVDALNNIDNIKIRYDLDTSAPYDCVDETYSGSETQFGLTDTDGFSWANGSSTFTGTVAISQTQTMCVYAIVDVLDTALNGETLNIIMTEPSTDVLVSGGAYVAPTSTLDLNGSTLLNGPIFTQARYHWRNDDGTESGATSATFNLEDTAVPNVARTKPLRLRTEISNEGLATSTGRTFTLEYGTKITTCSAIVSWTDVGAGGGDFDMYDSPNVTDGSNTTNVPLSNGGVTDENTTFKTPNSAVKDTSSTIASLTLTPQQFLEAEFSLKQTSNAAYNTSYCFRLVTDTVPAVVYSVYPELTTSPERDFEIQRGTVTISGTSATLTAGVDYVAPLASTSAFIRITNTNHTGAGSTASGIQNADDVTAYIQNPSNILSSVTIARPSTATGNTRVSWEIIEFIGEAGGDNEMIVRSQTAATYGTSDIVATGTSVSGVVDDTDVVVFITGQLNPHTATTSYNTGQSTSLWSSQTDEPVFTRGDTGGNASIVSYAVVEFKGPNWVIQRSEHTYTAAGVTETEPITALNSLSRSFIHTQKRLGPNATGTDEFGDEVWLSSIGFVSYVLEAGATSPSGQTSVTWIIENTQTSGGVVDVTRSNGSSGILASPTTISVPIGKTLTDFTNASILTNARSASTSFAYPNPITGVTIASTTHYELWRSAASTTLTYRTEIVEWPTAGLTIKQNYYRFYVDNDALDPSDPWPPGPGSDLGENTLIGSSDEPIGTNEHLRIRMSLKAVNATFPASSRTFRLQFGQLSSTCSAISEANWATLGDAASSTLWRGYSGGGTTDGAALSGDPPTINDLNLSVSDISGTLEEENDSVTNPFAVPESNDVEYDWFIQDNGAASNSYYCFRVVESDGTLLNEYLQYPQIRTANYTPRTQNWRWYTGINIETPTTALALENSAPADIADSADIALRITVKETKSVPQSDTRFKLQYSEYPNFLIAYDVATTSSCIATSTWCYADGGGVDNTKISTATLSDADICVASVGNGCGTHNESPSALTGFTHPSSAATEYQFAIQSAGPRVNRVYYFRLFDLVQGIPVTINNGETYPSLVTEGASLTFTMQGIASTTVTEGVTLDVTTTATAVPYGRLTVGADTEAAQRLSITTNATQGYQIYMSTNGDFLNSSGDTIAPITTTNAVPAAWATGCDVGASGCFGYHAGDDNLSGGSVRFFAPDTYARFSTTTLDEVVYGGGPVATDTVDMVYKVSVKQLQEAGQYTAGIRYIAVPVF
jgi:hypothetical protein